MATEKELYAEIEALKKKLEVANNRIKTEKYGVTWLDVPEAFEEDSENQLPILTELKEKAIKNEDGKPTHILIEGDNYHSLTCLNYTHKGKVDLIYIDPPYNTGTDGFRYKDKRVLDKYPDGTDVPKDSPLRHSYWLSFMHKRLELAKDLLKEDGVIYVSIDDNEQANLKLLMDKVFIEKNFIGTFVWEKKRKGSHLSKTFRSMTEYVLCYSKDISKSSLVGEKAYADKWQPLAKRTNSRKTLTFPKNTIVSKLEDGKYTKGSKGKGTSALNFLNDFTIKKGIIVDEIKVDGPFVWQQSKLDSEIKLGTIPSLSTKFGFNVLRSDQGSKTKTPSSLINKLQNVGTNEDAYEELSRILNTERGFDYPKPTSLIKYLVQTQTMFKKNPIILDFFAGTGTTGQAVLELNKEDNNNRQFILVTNNENSIMDNVTYPRLNRVIDGFDYEGTQKEIILKKNITWTEFKKAEKTIEKITKLKEKEGSKWDNIKIEIKDGILKVIAENTKQFKFTSLGNSLRYYKTDFVGSNNILSATDEDKSTLAHKAGYLLSIAENTLEEIELSSCYQMFENDNKVTAIYFKEELTEMETFLEKVEKIDKPIALYLFSWGNRSEFEALFDHLEHITIKTIPQPILEIYKRIYNIVTI